MKVISTHIIAIFICSGFFIEQINPLLFNDLHSSHEILINLETNQVIAENHISEKIYPASLAKIMTAILAIENTIDRKETLEIASDIFNQLYEQNASTASFEPNEIIAMEDLVYGLMLPSGAECSLTIERVISDSKKTLWS